MPALLAPLVGFSLGALFAWAASDELSRSSGSVLGTRSLAIVVLFAFLVFGPFAGYFLTYAPDWSFAYELDARRVPSAALLLLVLVDIAIVPIGFAVGALRARHRRLVPILPFITVPLAIAAVLVAVFSRKLAMYGSFGQVTRGFGAVPLAGSPVGYAVLWFDACLVLAAFQTTRELRGPAARVSRPRG